MTDYKKTESKLLIKAYGIKRKVLWKFLSKPLGIYLVAEYPKSGGTWYGQMLSDYLNIPFPRNTVKPKIEKCVLHGHELYADYKAPCSVLLRDGRDLMVSFYYHHLFKSDWNHHSSVEKHRKELGFKEFDDIRGNLPKFIEYMNTVWAKRFNHFTWHEFIYSWVNAVPEARVVKYEDLLLTPVATMERVIESLTREDVNLEKLERIIDKYSFEKISGRSKGVEEKSSFVRKGIAGDWVNHFSQDSKEVFHYYSGEALIHSGYEKNNEWAKS